MSRTIPCLSCDALFESRRGARRCRDCKQKRNKAKRDEKDAKELSIIEGLQAYLGDRHSPTPQQVRAGLKRLKAAVERIGQPAMWLSNAGSEDGCSTYWVDLRNELDWRRAKVAEHRWFADNPHWAVGIPGSEDMLEEADGLECGAKRGTVTGYKRHQNTKTMACPECTKAWRDYYDSKKYYAM